MSLPTALTGIVGEQIVVKSQTTDGYGSPSTSTVVWSSTNTAVAIVQRTIDLAGGALITCLTAGTATITATAGVATADFYLTVVSGTAGVAADVEILADQSFQSKRKMQ